MRIEMVKGQPVLYLECTNVIYGTLKGALLFYNKFVTDLKNYGFEINPSDRCVANKHVDGKQMTAIWHVDNLKASHVDKKVLEDLVEYLRGLYDDEEIGTLKVNCGPRHEFLGIGCTILCKFPPFS